MENKELESLKTIERLLERLICELLLDISVEDIIPITNEIFLEMEEEIGERIHFIGLS